MKKVYVTGSIDEESFKEFHETMSELTYDASTNEPIMIVLNSTGGSAVDALAFYEVIKECPVDVYCTVYGSCYSAAVLVLAACKHRWMTKTAWVMVHEDSARLKDATTSQFEAEANQMRRMENQWNYLLSENSSLSLEEWEYLHKKTTYLNAKECLELGLIEEIV